MIRSNSTPNPRGFKSIPAAADKDPGLDRLAVGLLTYVLGVDGSTTVTLEGIQEELRTQRIERLGHTPTLLRLIEGRREKRRAARSLEMLEAAGYVDVVRTDRRVEVVDAREAPSRTGEATEDATDA